MYTSAEAKIKHLEMVQGIMSRMSSNSFQLKGWAVTLVAGIFALSAKDSNMIFFMVSYVPVILFWFLDSYYLQLERKYKTLYDTLRNENLELTDFRLSAPIASKEDNTLYTQCFFSVSEALFYIPLGILVAIVIIISVNFLR